jgi:hypothetical protein
MEHGCNGYTHDRALFSRPWALTGAIAGRIRVRRSWVMETAYVQDLHAEGVEPDQEPVQRGLIPEGAVQDRFDRFH